MDYNSSSEENSSTECSTDSSDDDKLEAIQVCGTRLEIPQGLCEQKEILQELLSLQTWNSLSDTDQQHLRTFLPVFPENNDYERNVTLQRLLEGEPFRFTSPLTDFHEHLKAGHYRPDIAKIKYMIRKAERKEAKCRLRRYKNHLKEQVIESHTKLLDVVNNLPPGVEPRIERQSAPTFISPIAYRTKRRYFQDLAAIRAKVDESGFSSDENYPEGPPAPISRKQKRHLNSIKNSSNFQRVYVSTMATKPNVLDLESRITPIRNPFFITEDTYKVMLLNHKRRKLQHSDSSDLDTKSVTLSDVIQRTKLTYIKKINNPSVCVSKHNVDNKSSNRKRLKRDNLYSLQSPVNQFFVATSNSEAESDSDSLDTVLSATTLKNKNRNKLKYGIKHSPGKIIKDIKPENNNIFNEAIVQSRKDKVSSPIDTNNLIKSTNFNQYNRITPATLSDLDGIDMMNLPIDLDDSNIDILDLNNKPELMQETHANFLSLIRDIICSTNEHRMNMSSLEERLRIWQENPISPLNDWYSLTDNWVLLLQSAINFLSGNFSDQPEDFVPYIEYKPQLEMYQWIGAGRDSDSLLSPLCQYWLDHRNEMNIQQTDKKEENEIDIIDRSQTPPPPRCPTTWSVRKAEPEEIKAFREQERQRYDNPHKAFTYRCNGYESVVGPLKGIYNPSVSNTKARGHTMLSADRPNFVTILSLVRDATARLPNGEGTRADICELLKSSQYISSTAPDNVLQSVVSGALDRMHTQFDPCVKYDPKRKIWIYLHRNRTEEDFERLHQQYQGMSKNMKKSSKGKSQSKSKPKVEKNKNNVKQIEGNQNHTLDKTKNTTKPKANPSSPLTQSTQNSLSVDVNRPTTSKQPTSILLTSNQNQAKVDLPSVENVQVITGNVKRIPNKPNQQKTILTADEKDINEALQAIQNRITRTVQNAKGGKSLVKIISPTQSKSLIIPSTSQINKNVDQKTGTKISHAITQQLIQTLTNQQKQVNAKQAPQTIKIEIPEKVDTTKVQNKLSTAMQQQILQTISSQQLHNIKNVTLLRNVCASRQSPIQGLQSQNTSQAQTITLPQTIEGHNASQASIITIQKSGEQTIQTTGTSIRVQPTLSASQQQLLQNIKQKVIPMQNAVITPQVILKQKTAIQQGQKQIQTISGTSLLGQPRIATAETSKPVISSGQTPLVAKVLTNAAGQVISVESLLAHQKQHGSLPQGTTLRVSGVKGGQANIIQLATPTKQGSIAQLAVGSQNNFITISNQPKLVFSSQPTSTTTSTSTVSVSKPISKNVAKSQPITKVQPKAAQQVINAKFIAQNIDNQKVMQPKVIIGQNQIKIGANKNMTVGKQITVGNATTANTIRMVNATNLNLTHIGGKPVLLASKNSPIQNIQGQNVILQSQSSNSSGSNLVAINSSSKTVSTTAPTSTVSLINAQNTQVLLGSQLKVQQPSQVVLSSNIKQNSVQPTQNMLLGGQIRFQSGASGTSSQRVVLASQGQGGQIVAQQIVLPAGFQGTAINIKALQGVKVIPITQQGKGGQNRHVFARVMNPGNIVRIPQPASTGDVAEVNVATTE